MKRLIVVLIALVFLVVPAGVLADGDPGSDELISQNLYTGSENVSVTQQTQLDHLLSATAALAHPVRVAIIGQQAALGTVTQLWHDPAEYSWFLGRELSSIYSGRLVVVMPNGVALYWSGHTNGRQTGQLLTGIRTGSSPRQLVAGAIAAVTQLERHAGVPAVKLTAAVRSVARRPDPTVTTGVTSSSAPPTGAAVPTAGSTATDVSSWVLGAGLVVLLTAVFWLPPLWHRRAAVGRGRLAIPGLAVAITALAGLVVLALVIHSNGAGTASAEALATNPNVDSGTQLTPLRAAPHFRLTDETGHQISLSQYRGKVVILSFIDDECQTICPLTSTAMLDAKRSLGPAGKDVQLLAVDANWLSTQVDDVANYTTLHGMTGAWHFLTGSLPQLNRVWSNYRLNEYALLEKEAREDAKRGEKVNFNQIDHVASTYVIDPQGRWRTLYSTQTSYGAIPQLGQVLAQEASRLLPSHPKVQTDLSYKPVRGTSSDSETSLPRVGGGRVGLGPGHAHLYVFFDTWNQQSLALGARLESLNAYARVAQREGLPTPVAVDEGSVEPSSAALGAFLKTLPHPLSYPVAVDANGRVADGYGVQGEPWFVMTAPNGQTTWHLEEYNASWPSQPTLLNQARASLNLNSAGVPSSGALAGSPAPLARLHSQAAQTLGGGMAALQARIRSLRGYPIVVNVWYSTCDTCQTEAPILARASARYGRHVAFLGADIQDSPTNASQFMRQHHQLYPTYLTSETSLDALLRGGLIGTPTTIFINRSGAVVGNVSGEFNSLVSLGADIQSYLHTS